jgi:hypothetical protein
MAVEMTSNDESALTKAGNDPSDMTEIVPPVTHAAHEHAWSQEQAVTEVLRQPWSQAWSAAAVFLMPAVLVVMGIVGWALPRNSSHPSQSAEGRAANATLPATALPPISSAVVQPPAADARTVPPVAAPPSTVTVTPTAPTVTVQAAPPPASGSNDVFNICPDGHEGVVGGHTSCAFAANVRQTFYATGMANNFTAFSPVTSDGYEMTCVGRYTAYFTDGSTKISTRCYGGDNAEVVIW